MNNASSTCSCQESFTTALTTDHRLPITDHGNGFPIPDLCLLLSGSYWNLGFGPDGEDVFGSKDDVSLSVDGDFGAGVFAIEHGVSFLDFHLGHFAVIESFAGAGGEHLAFERFFLRAIGQDDAACGFLFLGGGFDDDAIV